MLVYQRVTHIYLQLPKRSMPGKSQNPCQVPSTVPGKNSKLTPRITTENLNKQRCRCRWTSSHHHSWGIRSGENWKNQNPTWQRLKPLENSQLLMVLCGFWVGYVGCGMATSPKKVDVSSPDQFSVPSNSCHPQHASKQLFTHHARHFGDIDHWVHWHLAKFGRFSWIVN